MILVAENVLNIKVGDRISSNGFLGTVQYVGEVVNTTGLWLGVDWDDAARGKHNGSHGGVQYFTARCSTSGSFIRPEKVNIGRSIVDAISERYASQELSLDEKDLQSLQKSMKAPLLEMVGFDKVSQKQSCFSNLRIVSVRDHNVSHAGEQNELGSMCPGIKELDLSKNLLKSWESVGEITCQLPDLTLLDLRENRLTIPEDPESLCSAFSTLSNLIISKINYTWDDILRCARIWPNILSLMVPMNNISDLNMPCDMFLNLKELDLEGNAINDWQKVNNLGLLPKLEILNVKSTGIKDIVLPSDKCLFSCLKYLILSDNLINEWHSISELNKLETLEQLQLKGNPITDSYDVATARQIVITRIARLRVLNRADINKSERQQAEYDYIKNNGQEWVNCQQNADMKAKFISEHPRYLELITKYGEAEASEFGQKSQSITSNLITIVLHTDEQSVEKKIMKSMAVNKLISLVQRLFHIGSTIPTLVYHSTKNPDIEVELNNLLRPLNFYSIEDGDKIFVKW